MKKLKTTTLYAFICLFLVTNIAFATDDDDNRPAKPGIASEETTTEDACGFFCSLGEFFEGIFS